ncbi:MAG TPA: hypothetical protein VMR41_04980 [Patescibacteria group bacterium]|nr:hypothetical protein [Patescibacteria group bacterium]
MVEFRKLIPFLKRREQTPVVPIERIQPIPSEQSTIVKNTINKLNAVGSPEQIEEQRTKFDVASADVKPTPLTEFPGFRMAVDQDAPMQAAVELVEEARKNLVPTVEQKDPAEETRKNLLGVIKKLIPGKKMRHYMAAALTAAGIVGGSAVAGVSEAIQQNNVSHNPIVGLANHEATSTPVIEGLTLNTGIANPAATPVENKAEGDISVKTEALKTPETLVEQLKGIAEAAGKSVDSDLGQNLPVQEPLPQNVQQHNVSKYDSSGTFYQQLAKKEDKKGTAISDKPQEQIKVPETFLHQILGGDLVVKTTVWSAMVERIRSVAPEGTNDEQIEQIANLFIRTATYKGMQLGDVQPGQHINLLTSVDPGLNRVAEDLTSSIDSSKYKNATELQRMFLNSLANKKVN